MLGEIISRLTASASYLEPLAPACPHASTSSNLAFSSPTVASPTELRILVLPISFSLQESTLDEEGAFKNQRLYACTLGLDRRQG